MFMELAFEKQQNTETLELIEAEITFWRDFVRSNHRVGDLEMVVKGQQALSRVLRRRERITEKTVSNVIRFPEP